MLQRQVNMKLQRLKFFIFSLCLHLPVFWLMTGMPAEYGMALDSTKKNRHGLTISLVNQASIRQSALLQNAATSITVPPHAQIPKPEAVLTASTTKIADTRSSTPEESNTDIFEEQKYLAVGNLTRLPAPLTPIDLNADDTIDMEPAESIDLTVLIDSDGVVTDVKTSDTSGMKRFLFARLAERFKKVRFSPGEINGRPVKARLNITVASEQLPAIEAGSVEVTSLRNNAIADR